MKSYDELVNFLDLYLVKKLPALPNNAREVLVKFAPWITIIVLLFSLQGILAFIGLRSMFYYPLLGARLGLGYDLSIVFLLITAVLRVLSIKGLFDRNKFGWNMVFYSVLVNAVYTLLMGDIVGMIIGTVLSLYVTFQVRSYYK
jgi:hypothetical protein